MDRRASAGRPRPGTRRCAPPISELRRQFAEDYPVDILFQDQVGARTWVYDRNPASPTPYAYAEGLLSQADEDARVRPLATEDGYDRVLNAEVQLCGFTFALVPGPNPSWARSFKSRYPATTWEIFPVAQVLAHEKAAMLHHDLGKFVSDRVTLSWTLGLGFAMSERGDRPGARTSLDGSSGSAGWPGSSNRSLPGTWASRSSHLNTSLGGRMRMMA